MTKFIQRQELIRAIAEGTLTPEQIAGLPEGDRELAELLVEFRVAGADRLIDAPETVIRKAEGIIDAELKPGRLQRMVAMIVFDSWAMPLPTGVRGAATVDERRVRFEAPPYMLDLRVEKQGGRYHCTAEVVGSADSSGQVVVLADGRTIQVGGEGLFEWSSVRPPRRLALQIPGGRTVELPGLSWNQSTEK